MAVNANTLDLLNIRTNWGTRIVAGERGRPLDSRQQDGRGSAMANAFRYSSTGQFMWQMTDDVRELEKVYASQIEACDLLDYINTEGSLWIDRVGVPTAELQRARLGGVALLRNAIFPGHVVSWRFNSPANDESVAILVKDATTKSFKVVAYNLETNAVHAVMTGWNIEPGTWEISQTTLGTSDGEDPVVRSVRFERSGDLEFTFAPRATNLLELTLKAPGTPYWQRPQLGFTREDVHVDGRKLHVRVHSLGAVASPQTEIVFRNRQGEILSRQRIETLPAPTDLFPKTADLELNLPKGADLEGASLEIGPEHKFEQITGRYTTVRF